MAMPKEAEPLLIAALNGSDPEFAKLEATWEQKSYVGRVADALAWLGRPAGRDAALTALAAADNDANRAGIAQTLYRYPPDPRLVPAVLDAYKKIPDGSTNSIIGGNPHVPLVIAAANLYDSSLTDWLLKEVATAKGEEKEATGLLGLTSAIKLMAPNQVAGVSAEIAKDAPALESDMSAATHPSEMLKPASAVVTKCGQDAACYVKVLDEPIPASPPSASMGALKACYMAGIYGNAGTKQELVNRVEKVRNGAVRLALVQAILKLAPQGDPAAAATLDKVVADDTAAGTATADDAVAKVAMMLRARAM
jgi:hypothetical protein